MSPRPRFRQKGLIQSSSPKQDGVATHGTAMRGICRSPHRRPQHGAHLVFCAGSPGCRGARCSRCPMAEEREVARARPIEWRPASHLPAGVAGGRWLRRAAACLAAVAESPRSRGLRRTLAARATFVPRVFAPLDARRRREEGPRAASLGRRRVGRGHGANVNRGRSGWEGFNSCQHTFSVGRLLAADGVRRESSF